MEPMSAYHESDDLFDELEVRYEELTGIQAASL
jgi:hypothetical protein